MWILRWILVIAVMIIILWFALQNQEPIRVNIGEKSYELPLYFHYFIAFVAGLLVWFIVSAFQILQVKSELRLCQTEKKRLQEELNALRNLPVEESIDEVKIDEQT
jgi:uncharacterized integral membrane protein